MCLYRECVSRDGVYCPILNLFDIREKVEICPKICKQFWLVTVKVDSHCNKEKIAHTTALWVRVE